MILPDTELAAFHREGFFVLRKAVSDRDCERLKDAVVRKLEAGEHTISVPPDKVFPEPAKYTLAANDWADPDLAFIVEHPTVLDAVQQVLGKPPMLTAFVAYSRPPGDTGAQPHCDHKRWRPVGSSLNWCFTIIPLVDFDALTGPLLVCPGSHKLIQTIPMADARTRSVTAPDESTLGPFIDPELERGDLLLLHGNTWHQAPPNRSDGLRIGIFNKYAACDAPPAAGYFKWSSQVHELLGPRGRQTLALHSDRELGSARLLLERFRDGRAQILLRGDDALGWELPGGRLSDQRNRALEVDLHGAWDVGNKIAALEEACTAQLGFSPTWMSYIADFEEQDHLCRVYGNTLSAGADDPPLPRDARWFFLADIAAIETICPFVANAVEAWCDDERPVLRGKGKAEHRCVPVEDDRQYED